MKKMSTEKIPAWALGYLVNGDPIYDATEEDMDNINVFLATFSSKRGLVFGSPNEEDTPYFTTVPAFGLPTEVYDIDVYEA